MVHNTYNDKPNELYFKDISKIPLLTREEELELARAVARGDEEARKKLILSNLKLVIHIAKNYTNKGLPLMDLIEEGNMGLMRATDKFKPELGYRFATYATWWIKQAMTRAIVNLGSTIRVPVHVLDQVRSYYKVRAEFIQQKGEEPTLEEISNKMGVDASKMDTLIRLLEVVKYSDSPMSREIYEQFLERLEDKTAMTPAEFVELHLRNRRLQELIRMLTEREQRVVQMRFGFKDGKFYTLSETGIDLGVSRERIRQIEKKALQKLRRLIDITESRLSL